MQGNSFLAAVAGLVLALVAADAHAATINVSPGPNAIQTAVDRADPGDKLLVKRGTYREALVVDKRLQIVGNKGKRPVIDGGCDTDRTIDIVANGVGLRHLTVKGARSGPGDGYTINLIGVASGRLRDLVLRESCDGSPAYYGVNVFGTGALEITGLVTSGGFVDAGIYVGGIGDVGADEFRIERSKSAGNNVGILIEDSVPEANIMVHDNLTRKNDLPGLSAPAGILVRRSDGGRYSRNQVRRNGDYGIHLDADSQRNRLFSNTAGDNGVQDFFDEGSGNCGSQNSFPIGPC